MYATKIMTGKSKLKIYVTNKINRKDYHIKLFSAKTKRQNTLPIRCCFNRMEKQIATNRMWNILGSIRLLKCAVGVVVAVKLVDPCDDCNDISLFKCRK